MAAITPSFIDKLYNLIQQPIFWATATAIFASSINVLLFLINRKTFKLLYVKPYIHIKSISIAAQHKSPDGMIPDGTYIDMEVINSSSCQNLILGIQISFLPFTKPFLKNGANIILPPFSKHRLPQTLGSTPFDKYKNKLIKITLLDIKGRKIIKYCVLKSS